MTIAIVFTCYLTAAALPAASQTATIQLGPGFLTAGGVYLTTGPSGTLLAIQMGDGKTRWETSQSARIFAIHQDRLLAVVPCDGKLCVGLFRAGDGRTVWRSPALPLPRFAPIPTSMLEPTNPVGSLYLHDTRRAFLGIRFVGATSGALQLHVGSASKYVLGVPPPPGHPIGERYFADIHLNSFTGALTVKLDQSYTLHYRQPSPPDPWQASVPELRGSIPASWTDSSGKRFEVNAGESLQAEPTGRFLQTQTQTVVMRALSPTGSLLWQRPLAPIVTHNEPLPP